MALLKCPDCGGNVSDKANACTHCGRPNDFGELCPKCGNKRELAHDSSYSFCMRCAVRSAIESTMESQKREQKDPFGKIGFGF